MIYYINITEGTSLGAGTTTSPYNIEQFNTQMKNIANGDVFYVKGQLEITSSFGRQTLVETLGNSIPVSPIMITVRGWDIDINGSPIISWSNPTLPSPIGNGWWDSPYKNINVIIKDFIVNAPHYFQLKAGNFDGCEIQYNDVLFVVDDIRIGHATPSSNNIYSFLGCTLNFQVMELNNIQKLTMYDCIFNSTGVVSINTMSELIMESNNGTIENFTNFVYNIQDISNYIQPTFDQFIIATPRIIDFAEFVDYYTQKELLWHKLYNIPEISNPYLQNLRISNGYNNGLFGESRVTYGAYYFYPLSAIPDTPPTSGFIGSFYFGGEYNSVEGVSDLALTVEVSNVEIAVDIRVGGRCDLYIEVVDKPDYCYTSRTVDIDFVAKIRNDETFPKFCNSMTGLCDSDEYSDYSTPITGGGGIIVDFLAIASGLGTYENYLPVKYTWYFDYANNPTIFVTCAGPSATHNYCGAYMDNYDVRLCVDMEI